MEYKVYIVYNTLNNHVIATFEWYKKAIRFTAGSPEPWAVLNSQHPMNKEKLLSLVWKDKASL